MIGCLRIKSRTKANSNIVAVAALDSVSIVVDDVVVGVLILTVVIIAKEVVERI